MVRLEPADAGTAIQQAQGTAFGVFNGNNTAGGGNLNNDGRYVSGDINATPGQIPGVGGESVVEFLQGRKGTSNPFYLFVSLVNPHDIGAYPGNLITPPAWQQVGYKREDFAHLGIKLPPNYADDLSTKPSIQKLARDNYDKFAPLDGLDAQEEYINFYAYLIKSSTSTSQPSSTRSKKPGSWTIRSSCALPIMARAGCHTGFARRPIRPTRK